MEGIPRGGDILCEASKCSFLIFRALFSLGQQLRMVIHIGMTISNTS